MDLRLIARTPCVDLNRRARLTAIDRNAEACPDRDAGTGAVERFDVLLLWAWPGPKFLSTTERCSLPLKRRSCTISKRSARIQTLLIRVYVAADSRPAPNP